MRMEEVASLRTTHMLLKLRTELTPHLDQPVPQHPSLPQQVLELQRPEPRPLDLWQVRQGRELLMQHGQVLGRLIACLGGLLVDDPGGVGLRQQGSARSKRHQSNFQGPGSVKRR